MGVLIAHRSLVKRMDADKCSSVQVPASSRIVAIGNRRLSRICPHIIGILVDPQGRRALLKEAFEQLAVLIAMSILLDAISQFLILHEVFPGPAVIVGPVLIALPYSLARAMTNRIVGHRLKAWLFAQSRDWDPECDEIHRRRRRFYDRYHTIRRRRIMHSSPAFRMSRRCRTSRSIVN